MAKRGTGSIRWIEIRKELYNHVKKNVSALLGHPSESFRKYEIEYENEFKKKWVPSHRLELLTAIEEAKILWLGDFHALQQSQKAQLRILKALREPARWVLFLECIEAKNQKFLDQYSQGQISERDFLKAIQWKKSWGFPWEHYKPIFRWANRHQVKLIAVNLWTEDRSLQGLKKRDQFSAGVMADAVKKLGVDRKYAVIYGDLHLATKHLPSEFHKYVKNMKSAYVFQNPEEIYFELLSKEVEHQVDVVKLGSQKFALTSVPPWVKWQNYLIYLESQTDRPFDDELDLTDYVAKFVQVIGSDLEIKVSLDHFEVITAQDIRALEKLRKTVGEGDFRLFKYWIESGKSFFEPQSGLAYLGSQSVNSASQLAMAIVLSSLNKFRRNPTDFPKQFVHLIWLEACLYFGSKLVNPKRKSDTLNDIKQALVARDVEEGREALQLALSQKMLELLYLSEGRKQRELLRPRKYNSYLEAARILGGILGEKIFYGYRKKMISQKTLHHLLQKPLESPQFGQIYWEILEVIESLPEPFKSKKDKI